jgi:hypothetical protein
MEMSVEAQDLMLLGIIPIKTAGLPPLATVAVRHLKITVTISI